MQPFIFHPILKEVIWGGTDIRPFKGLSPDDAKIGESWELSHVDNNLSVVTNDLLAGQSIRDLINHYGVNLSGEKAILDYGDRFPLLIKFIDARDDLSIQVHPDNKMAWKHHQSPGKTEMWYVIKAAPGAALYSGFNRHINKSEFTRRVADGTLTDVLQRFDVAAGDVFFLPAGRVHGIGAGCFIAEIQQTSDITYRIYDYGRTDANGNPRELHIDQAEKAIDFNVYPDGRTVYTPARNEAVRLVTCPYFVTNLLELDEPVRREHAARDSFVILICTEGNAVLYDDKGYTLAIRQGQTVLYAARTQWIHIHPQPQCRMLEVYYNT